MTDEQHHFYGRVALAGLLHMPEEHLPELESATMIESQINTTSELFETGKQRPFYALWEWRIKEARQHIKVAQSVYYPSLWLNAGMNMRYSNSSDLDFWDQNKNNLGKYVSLNLNIPIFNGFQARNAV